MMLREADRRVSDGLLSKTRFEELQLACGLNYNASGLLASARLMSHCSLIGSVTYDWVHTALQDGCFVIEASMIVSLCEDHVEVTSRGYVPSSMHVSEAVDPLVRIVSAASPLRRAACRLHGIDFLSAAPPCHLEGLAHTARGRLRHPERRSERFLQTKLGSSPVSISKRPVLFTGCSTHDAFCPTTQRSSKDRVRSFLGFSVYFAIGLKSRSLPLRSSYRREGRSSNCVTS